MKVFLSATSYPASATDWKGLFIQRMIEGLQRRNTLALETWCPPGPPVVGVSSALQADDGLWLGTLAARGGIAQLLRRHPVRGAARGASMIYRQRRAMRASRADIFHINWLQNALALPSDTRPALVTALGTDMQLLHLPCVTRQLRRRFTGRKVVICPNADWMVAPLQATFADVADVSCVPFGIDAAWFDTARQPTRPAKWLCVSRLTTGKLGKLFDWAEPYFRERARILHLIGPRQDQDIEVPPWVEYHGPATPKQLREHWFPSATGLVSLSAHPEGRPQVMLEAMAAGLPILATRLPAHEDLIAHRDTGWLCDDSTTFAEGLELIEHSTQNKKMGDHARQFAKARFGTWDDCANRYARQYEILMQGRP